MADPSFDLTPVDYMPTFESDRAPSNSHGFDWPLNRRALNAQELATQILPTEEEAARQAREAFAARLRRAIMGQGSTQPREVPQAYRD
jgi:hypothetical protein